MKAVVLCAGFGSRLAPLTDRVPKPLVPVANRPVLGLVLDRLHAAGVEEVGINLHHRADDIRSYLATRDAPRFRTAFEPEILDTGGGIANFGSWIEESGDPYVLLHNSDVVTDVDLPALVRAHEAHDAEATLVLVDHRPTNYVAYDGQGNVIDIRGRLRAEVATARTYAGIAVLSSRFLRRLQPGRRSSVVDAFLDAMRERAASVRAHVPEGVYWRDLGRVEHYLDMHREILVGGRLAGAGLDPVPGGILVHPTARIEPTARLEGFVAVGEGCHIASGVHLADCVVWPGTRIEGRFAADHAVISQDLVVAA